MYGTNGGGRFGRTVGSGASSRCPRLTANRKNPFSAWYLMCHVAGDRAVPARNAATASAPIAAHGRPRPDRPAEGAEDGLVGLAPLPERAAEGHVLRDQIVDVHSRPSRSKSPTARSPARSTLA